MNKIWHLISRPNGLPAPENFELRDILDQDISDGLIRVENTFLSVDPYMRPRMDDVESYVEPFHLDAPLTGGAVGVVIESKDPKFKVGDRVFHGLGWRNRSIVEGQAATLLPRDQHTDEQFLNELGMIGATAYFGLLDVAQARPGGTLFVSAGAGAVGSLVIQIAKLRGMRVIASAGGPEKCEVLRNLGADSAIDYKSTPSLEESLREAAPEGIDSYFDNVGGGHLDAAMAIAKNGANFAICGMIDIYNSKKPTELANIFCVISKRINMRGFIVSDFNHRLPEFHAQMSRWINGGNIHVNNSIFFGLEAMPEAFLALFNGGSIGKILVEI